MPDRWLEVETRPSDPVQLGENRLVLFAQSWRLRLPGWHGGIVWNRPVSVLTQSASGEEIITPIRDITRETQWMVWGGALITVAALSWLLRLFRRRKE